MANNLIYVYCISSSLPESNINFDAEGLKFLMLSGFCVTVKYVSDNEFSEENLKKNLSDIKWLTSNASDHLNKISLIMKYGSVIPFKFGTIFNTEDSLRTFIANYSESLTENLNHINGKEEWGVKIYCDRKALSQQIDELSEEAASLEKQIMDSSPGKAFILKRKKTELVENEMDRLCNVYGQNYYDDLKKLSESTNFNNLLPKDYTERQDDMILNAAFLVDKTNVAEFTNTINLFGEKDRNSGFLIEATGPWPPFSFISIKEKQ